MSKRHAFFAIVAAIGLSGCGGAWQSHDDQAPWPMLRDTCDYDQVAVAAIKERYPWFVPPGKLASAQYRDVIIAFYPLPEVMPGGTAHATISVRNCKVQEVWITQ